jgi:hypothetical protein
VELIQRYLEPSMLVCSIIMCIVILGRIQGTLMQGSKDRRDITLSTNTNMDLPTEEESLR